MTSTLPPAAQAFSGGIGSVIANAGAFPLDVIVTRLQTQRDTTDGPRRKKLTALDVIEDIVAREGYLGLFAGFGSDSLATLISNAVYFYVYSYARQYLGERRVYQKRQIISSPSPYPYTPPPPNGAMPLSTTEELAAGFFSGVISRLISSPLNVVTVRQQVARDEDYGFRGPPGILSTMRRIYNDAGLLGFWKGFQSTILLCSNPAITLFLFQVYRRNFLRGRNREVPTAMQAFIGAAASNAFAVTLLYPLMLIKTRLQSSHRRDGHTSISKVIQEVVRRKGIAGLYDGLNIQLLKGIVNQGLTMMTKQRIETILVTLYFIYRQKRGAMAS